MDKLILTGKILLISILSFLSVMSLFEFIILTGIEDANIPIIRNCFLGLLFISILLLFIIVRKELKPSHSRIEI